MALADFTDTQRSFISKYVASLPGDAAPEGMSDWDKICGPLQQKVSAALKANHPEAGKIRAVWTFAQEKAAAGDAPSAVKAAGRLDEMLAADTPPSEIPTNVVAFQKSRILWISAKRDMQSGLATFRNAVAAAADDDDDKDAVLEAADLLVAQFEAFDTELEEVLDKITQTPEGDARTALKRTANKALQGYLKALDGPFFSIVDSNPFTTVNVAARGRQALSTISATLS